MSIEIPAPVRPRPALHVVFEDDSVLVVDKPSGIVMHPAYRHPDGTLWNMLASLFVARGLPDRPHLLHRLDRDTSGLICVPKQLAAHRALERALRAGRFEKGYLALVHGSVAGSGIIDAPLGRDTTDVRRVVVRSDGRPARTHYRVLRRLHAFTLLRVTLETGRMHQIRVHLAMINAPLAGDPVYGPADSACGRLFLHADRLAFPHPNGGAIVRCRSLLPDELRVVLHRCVRLSR